MRRTHYRKKFFLFGIILLFLAAGCLSAPAKKLWPPPADQKNYEIAVINYDDLHTSLAVYPADYDTSTLVEEFSFGEKDWYMENHRGILDGIKALFWFNPSVVETHNLAPSEFETKIKPAKKIWRYRVTQKGRDKIFQYLETWYYPDKFIKEKDNAKYFEGRKPYNLFTACHHMTAGALKSAGLPISPWWAYTENLFAIQLKKAEKIQSKAGITAG